MNSNTIFFRDRKEKLEIINAHFPHLFSGKVLDVGCGDRYLKEFIEGEYLGIDKYGNPDISKDVSEGLPFEAKTFDTVAAFDILEHIDNIHFVFDELCRVSRKWVIITLPNLFEWRFRLSFLFGKLPTEKYGLPAMPPSDRHRWLFSLNEAKKFIQERAERNGFAISQDAVCYYKYNKILPRMITKAGSLLGGRLQNLFASHYLAILQKS